MITIVPKKHEERDTQKKNEENKIEIYPYENKNVAHCWFLQATDCQGVLSGELEIYINLAERRGIHASGGG
jgi:GTP cyclohydrolase FolE2